MSSAETKLSGIEVEIFTTACTQLHAGTEREAPTGEGEPDAERTAKECDELTAALDEIKGRLEGLRSSLWDPAPSATS